MHVLFGSPNDHLTKTRYLTSAYALGIGREPIEALDIHADSLRLLTDRRKFAVCLDHPLGSYPTRAIGTSWHNRRSSGECLLRPDPFGNVELHSAAECFIVQMRICDLRVRIVRDGHEPNEAEEQRPGCVPIEPVHVISSPKDRREQEVYQNSGSFGENRWGDFAGVNPLSFARDAIVAETCHALPYRMAMNRWARLLPATSPCLQHFATPFPMAKHRVPARATDYLVREDLGHHATSSRSSTRRGLEGCLDCFRPIPVGFNHREDRRSGTPPLDGD